MKKEKRNKKGNVEEEIIGVDSRRLKVCVDLNDLSNSIRLVGYPHSWLEKFEDGCTLDQLKNLFVSTSIELDRTIHSVTSELCVMYGAIDKLMKVIKRRDDEGGESAVGMKTRNTEKFIHSKVRSLTERAPGYLISLLQTMYEIKTGQSASDMEETENLLDVFIVSLIKMNSLWIKEIEWNQKSNKD